MRSQSKFESKFQSKLFKPINPVPALLWKREQAFHSKLGMSTETKTLPAVRVQVAAPSPVSLKSTEFIRVWNPNKQQFEERKQSEADTIAKNNHIGKLMASFDGASFDGRQYIAQLRKSIEDISLSNFTALNRQLSPILEEFKTERNVEETRTAIQEKINSIIPHLGVRAVR